MELWLDTIDLEVIKDAADTLKITGVTTNPSILSKSDLPLTDIIESLLTVQPGHVAVQVNSKEKDQMLSEAEAFAAISKRIIVKVPVTKQGLGVISYLSQLSIPTMATAIYEPSQVLLSSIAGATYAAPYIGRIEEIGGNHIPVLLEMMEIVKRQKNNLKIIAAAIRSKQQILDCSRLGVSALTVAPNVYQEFLKDNTDTLSSLEAFEQDWNQKSNRAAAVS